MIIIKDGEISMKPQHILRKILNVFGILISAVFLVSVASAKDIELTDFYLEFEKPFQTSSPNLPAGEHSKFLPALGFDLKFFDIGYLETTVSSDVNEEQFRYVDMENELGIRPVENFEIYIQHYSGHLLDGSYGQFPFENTIGFRIHFGDF